MSSKASSTEPRTEPGEGAATAFARFRSAVLDLPLPAGLCVVVLPRVGSTNALARRLAREYFRDGVEPPRCLVVAWEQDRGRGRRGRAWSSPAGCGVYASLLHPVAAEEPLHTVPLLAAVALCRAVQPHLPRSAPRCRLKWPNDVLLGDRKLGGLLIEAVSGDCDERALVIGFGVNHRSSDAVREAAGDWGSVALTDEAPAAPSLAELLGELVASLAVELEKRGDEAYARHAYEALSMHRPGDRIRCRDGETTVAGEFLGFDERGFLRLRPDAGGGPDGELRLAAGEVVT